MEIVAEAGMPPGVINFVPGPGGDIGDALVEHPRTRFINFTGSKEVGLGIAQRAAVVQPGQTWLKRAYMEMGGKDAIVVDETADLDAAAEGIVRSAYGFQGQKCSACSRLIAVDAIHDELVDRVVARTEALEVGNPEANIAVGPVISAAQHKAILAEIEKGTSEAVLLTGGTGVDLDGGYYIRPTIFGDVHPHARLAQHEIFGPVLSVIRARDFDHALDIANDTEFGLTGGLYTSDESRVERARADFHGRQPVHQPQDHGRARRDPAVRRVQDVGLERQGRWSGLPPAVHGDEVRRKGKLIVAAGCRRDAGSVSVSWVLSWGRHDLARAHRARRGAARRRRRLRAGDRRPWLRGLRSDGR